jgi:hypothetical protein
MILNIRLYGVLIKQGELEMHMVLGSKDLCKLRTRQTVRNRRYTAKIVETPIGGFMCSQITGKLC